MVSEDESPKYKPKKHKQHSTKYNWLCDDILDNHGQTC